jgi:uncharacterized protein with GYD domain
MALFFAAVNTAAWAAMIKRPQDRVEAVRTVVEKLGGKIGSFWMAFGDYELIGILAKNI